MPRSLSRRLAHTIFVPFAVSILTFLLIDLAPGDYFERMRMSPQITPETVAALRDKYGLNQSLPVKYVRWLGSVARGEMGFSFAYDSPVWPLLRVRARNTLILTLAALIFSWVIAMPVGVWSAARCGGLADRISTAGTTFLLTLPDVLVALALLAVALKTGWFPSGGMRSLGIRGAPFWDRVGDLLDHLALPVLALATGIVPALVRHVRAAFLDVLDAPFLAAARGHGIPRRRLLLCHALPAAANPLISLLGVSVGTLLSGSLLIEVVMSWPGVGPMLLEAILERDMYVVVAAVMFSTLFLVAGNFLADVLLYLADPRIRVE